MKVLLVGTGVHPIPPAGYGAVERILAEYGAALTRAGHTVEILNAVRNGRSRDEYWFALGLPAQVRRRQCDVVHASTPVVANRLAVAGLSYVYTSHSRHWFWRRSWRHEWGYWLERRAVRHARATVALTDDVAAAIRSSLRSTPPGPLRVIPFGIDSREYSPAWERRTGRRALGVGVVLPFKRWELAAAALRGTGVALRIAGPAVDSEYAARVRAAGENVELLGEVDERQLRDLYAESDVLVHPSVVEVLPRAVLEAMASGLPVVGSSVIRSLFPEGAGGRVAPAGLPDTDLIRFFRASVEDLVRDPTARRELGEAGRRAAVETYSWERVVRAHEELYRQVAGT